jgi:hypothetical protein
MYKLITILWILFTVAGCATAPRGASIVDDPADLPSIQAKNADELSKIKIGMALNDFQIVFPEAYVGGQNQDTTAYEIVNIQKYVTQSDINRQNFWWGGGSPNARSSKQVLWFYFYKDQLVRWGRPQDWPDRADLIIEKRNR